MAFGPIMRLPVGDLEIELAPLARDNLEAFISPGMQQASVSRYLANHSAPVIETEQEWFDRVRTNKNSLVWGIYDVTNDERRVIGVTSLNDITKEHIWQAVSGSQICDTSYWRKGIASAIHRARTWYAFEQYGLGRIKSGVIQGNVASRKALEKSGYTMVYVERNAEFVQGHLRHVDNLKCLNPAEWSWSRWWGSEEPTEQSLEARERTSAALAWATENVVLP